MEILKSIVSNNVGTVFEGHESSKLSLPESIARIVHCGSSESMIKHLGSTLIPSAAYRSSRLQQE